ncbi:MAG: hypothetical protein MK110_19420 [Fuerstiella sp.]|nr:hypothetical protein [Fuerstiella sp.]
MQRQTLFRLTAVIIIGSILTADSGQAAKPVRVGILGFDSYQALAFTQLFHNPPADNPDLAGLRVVVAMLIAWEPVNFVCRPNSEQFTRRFAIIAAVPRIGVFSEFLTDTALISNPQSWFKLTYSTSQLLKAASRRYNTRRPSGRVPSKIRHGDIDEEVRFRNHCHSLAVGNQHRSER